MLTNVLIFAWKYPNKLNEQSSRDTAIHYRSLSEQAKMAIEDPSNDYQIRFIITCHTKHDAQSSHIHLRNRNDPYAPEKYLL